MHQKLLFLYEEKFNKNTFNIFLPLCKLTLRHTLHKQYFGPQVHSFKQIFHNRNPEEVEANEYRIHCNIYILIIFKTSQGLET